MVAFGEIGLTGELRPVAYGEERLREAAKQRGLAGVIAKRLDSAYEPGTRTRDWREVAVRRS